MEFVPAFAQGFHHGLASKIKSPRMKRREKIIYEQDFHVPKQQSIQLPSKREAKLA